ncbi:alpha-ketoglutarate-dependent dioxygenase AlkB [Phanerochaete sordida]|uniref:Alpha-ketoglutarate-dependent dioxygenase AlkB n=1 Tax=Phanerochaete sordida TaxID=48140 RepID=A0A9P3GMG7_9APHY|nr:alpha-ketoglutarate-dependent dioxygenase AlkB [Phanerochaete sordida]
MTETTSLLGPSLTPAQKKARKQHLKTTKNRPADIEDGWTPFRAAEKRFKAKWPLPDMSTVLDLHHEDMEGADEGSGEPSQRGRRDAVEWRQVDVSVDQKGKGKAYAFPRVPGLVYLPSFVSAEEQRRLVRWSLQDHAKPPNESNLDAHHVLPPEGLWNAYLRSLHDGTDNEESIQPKVSGSSSADSASPVSPASNVTNGPRTLIANPPASPSLLATLLTLPTPPPTPSPNAKPCSPAALVPKLRWANIGWHYHWGNKQYDFTRGRGGGVADVYRAVCMRAVRGVDWESVYSGEGSAEGEKEPFEEWKTWPEEYEPDAGIVNFYQTRDTLMAHVDRSELCATSPLVSISLGCSAIFLIGGPTRDTEPIPILLRSGDVLIMSGPCRRAYHGVPRILEDTCPTYLLQGHTGQDGEGDEWKPYADYMRNARINVNVRQVFPRGFDPGLPAA